MYRESYFRVGRDVPVEAEFTRKFQVVQDRNEEMKATLMAVHRVFLGEKRENSRSSKTEDLLFFAVN